MIRSALLTLVLVWFPLSGENDADVKTDQLLKRVDVKVQTKPEGKKRPSKLDIKTKVSTAEPEIVVSADPNGDAIKCTIYNDGRPAECVVITALEDVERELREQVRIATRSIGIPGLQVQTRPQPEALINIDTMLYTEADTFERTVNLLGRDVTIRAVPSQFMWHHGDGTTQTTRSPGKSTASSDVAHVYRKPVVGLRLSVDTTWRIEYRVASGPWRELDETLTVSGPVTTLTTREARPILVGP